MKKIISVVLALVMMMAIMVPAFAETIISPNTTGSAIVSVDGVSDKGDGTYSVEIPASVDLTWGDTTKAGEYKITSQVQTEKRVKVALAKAKDLTNAANETIEFAVADATTGIANSAVVNSEAHTFNLTIDAGEWAAASIAAYEGTITFTAELVDA